MAQFIWNKQSKKAILRKDYEQIKQDDTIDSSEQKSAAKRKKVQKEEATDE